MRVVEKTQISTPASLLRQLTHVTPWQLGLTSLKVLRFSNFGPIIKPDLKRGSERVNQSQSQLAFVTDIYNSTDFPLSKRLAESSVRK